MDYNQIIAQQQAILNQAYWTTLAVFAGVTVLGCFITYLFYARLRDIGDELRRIRVTYEMSEERKIRSAQTRQAAAHSEDDRYKPKP